MFCIKLISNIEVKIRKALKRLWGVRERVRSGQVAFSISLQFCLLPLINLHSTENSMRS